MAFTVGSYTASTVIPGVPIYRFFNVERMDQVFTDGPYLNGDTSANAVTATSAALPTGALLPGNLVYLDTTSTSGVRPNVKRVANTATSGAIANATTAPTVIDGGTGGSFANALYTVVYAWKNAAGQITNFSAAGTVTPTGTHKLSVALPTFPTNAVSADIYCSEDVGGADAALLFLGNQVVATAVLYAAPPAATANPLPDTATTNNTTSVISSLSGAILGLVYGSPVYRYAPTDNAIYTTEPVDVIRGRFTALLDINSFEASHSPTDLGQKIYPSANGSAADLGKLSTTKVASTNEADYNLGVVTGFEQGTNYGGPGVQQSSTYGSGTGTQVLVGGITLVRVQFDIPFRPLK